jgi:hypothetical protein
MRKIVFISTVVLALASACNAKKQHQYVNGCQIYDSQMQPIEFLPGDKCDFRADGSYITVFSPFEIKFFDKHNVEKWSKPYSVHHYLRFSPDGKFIYLSTDEITDYMGNKTRFDVVTKVSAEDGKEVASWSLYKNLKEIQDQFPWKYNPNEHESVWAKESGREWLKHEYLHFNSLNIIPKNLKSRKLSYLHEGNVIVTPGQGLVLIFNPDLKLVHSVLIDSAGGVNYHDFQITKDGDLLAYNNWYKSPVCPSVLKIIDIETLKIKWSFSGNAQTGPFCSLKFGAVQILEDNNILFTDISYGGKFQIIDRKGNLLKQFYNPIMNSVTKLPEEIFKLKMRDLNQFLEARKK